jgi:hypothetical protein
VLVAPLSGGAGLRRPEASPSRRLIALTVLIFLSPIIGGEVR